MKSPTSSVLAGCVIVVIAGCASAPKSTADARDVKPKECDFPHDAARETHYRYDPLRKDISLLGPDGVGTRERPAVPGSEWHPAPEASRTPASTDGNEQRLAPCQ